MLKYVIIFLLIGGCTTKEISKIYHSESLIIKQLSDHSYQHISYLQTDDYGKVACNGMIVVDNHEAIIFDTPAENEVSEELITWVEYELTSKVVAIVPTHFHSDCLGGLATFHERQIQSIAHNKTIQLLDSTAVIPWQGFDDFINLTVGQQEVIVDFVGKGHTTDNVIAYFPSEQILFGGCLIKSLKAGKGYLGDANLEEWSDTVEKIKSKYLEIKTVIPGHGEAGGTELLNKTIEMFQSENQ
ncbi:MAG: subclass B1 metallo-beta-lactamase [Reichenbachiella sp.]|uniref:subclass B1 metallo-beta-lactamase n=1 Tax=Reichenbachiella sp. TaxID=2184521 RepID=UPI0032982BFB